MPNVSPPPTTAENLDGMLEIYRRRSMVDWNVNASGLTDQPQGLRVHLALGPQPVAS